MPTVFPSLTTYLKQTTCNLDTFILSEILVCGCLALLLWAYASTVYYARNDGRGDLLTFVVDRKQRETQEGAWSLYLIQGNVPND